MSAIPILQTMAYPLKGYQDMIFAKTEAVDMIRILGAVFLSHVLYGSIQHQVWLNIASHMTSLVSPFFILRLFTASP